MVKEKKFITIPIKFQVKSNSIGLFLIPPPDLKRLLLGQKPRRGKSRK